MSAALLAAGDRVQLTGPKNRLHTIVLEPGKVFHSHRGALPHDDLIGLPEGSVVPNSAGAAYLALRPLLADYVMSMPRGAAIVYPKDAAQILQIADVHATATVVEAGVGSGALSLWLLRVLNAEGRLISVERRPEFAEIAAANVDTWYGGRPDAWRLEIGDFQDVATTLDEDSVDAVVLDMLAPWECVDEAARILAPGGVVCCYVATVTQLSRVAEALRASGRFTTSESVETLVRGWHVEGLAVRPNHRMVGHTGYLISARLLAPGTVLPQPARRASKSEYDDEDVELWTPGALGERVSSDKVLRKKVRAARTHAAAPGRATAGEPGADADDDGADL